MSHKMNLFVTDSGFSEFRREDNLRAARKAESFHQISMEKTDMTRHSIFMENRPENIR